ncbi:hypothetical protein FRX31_020719 [Thalictrum thalictroides]|uniref:Pectinesterase inhibitor domain-containing protein n=1 Tax=Thalictrum thalictroides TaxID=46969 RepID=A0A7J6VX48_THATH|nr:hypothetical protein FRX31_020719 [Thalictrum thalictroides]
MVGFNKIACEHLKTAFCEASLGLYPGCHSADIHGLDLIAMRLSEKIATATVSYIENLLINKTNDVAPIVARLDASDNVDLAVNLLNSTDIFGAGVALSVVLNAPLECEDSFKEVPGLTFPLTHINDVCRSLFTISLAITNRLLLTH